MKFSFKDKKRILTVFLAVITMGFSLSFLIRVNFGTDPCSSMNLGISDKIGISFGTWQVFLNVMLFLIVILIDRSNIGWGTVANMILVGYSADFFMWLFNLILPTDFFTSVVIRIIVLVPSLIIFILAASTYMSVDLGTAPYDAVSFILAAKIKIIPFRVVRMGWDIAACLIGFLTGGSVGVVTIVMAFLIGPVIVWVRSKLDTLFQPASI